MFRARGNSSEKKREVVRWGEENWSVFVEEVGLFTAVDIDEI